MTHGSLFSGIGGFDLAAAWAGWTNVFNCEIDPFCRRVLKYHFPESEQYEDIRTTDFTVWRDCIDVLTGDYNVCFRYAAYKVMDEELIPAFTVADLLQMLPKILHDNRGNELPINVTASTGSNWCLFYGNCYGHAWWKDSDSLVDLLIEAIEWLVTNGYPLNV